MQLLKSFQLDKKLVETIESQISNAERAGLSAKLAADDGVSAEISQVTLIEKCKLATLAKTTSDAEAAMRVRASRQVISRPSSSLSIAQALLDVDQVRASPLFAKYAHICACRQSPALQAMKMMALRSAVAVQRTSWHLLRLESLLMVRL